MKKHQRTVPLPGGARGGFYERRQKIKVENIELKGSPTWGLPSKIPSWEG